MGSPLLVPPTLTSFSIPPPSPRTAKAARLSSDLGLGFGLRPSNTRGDRAREVGVPSVAGLATAVEVDTDMRRDPERGRESLPEPSEGDWAARVKMGGGAKGKALPGDVGVGVLGPAVRPVGDVEVGLGRAALGPRAGVLVLVLAL